MNKKYNKEDKKSWIEKQNKELEKINEEIQKLANDYKSSPEDYFEYLDFSSKFYEYSMRNQLLIYNQNPYANYCGSYNFYKEQNYSVKKGEKGIKILVPVKTTFLKIPKDDSFELKQLLYATQKEKEQYKKGLLDSEEKLFFKLGNVFEVSQTNIPTKDIPKIFNYTSLSDKDYLLQKKALLAYAEKKSIAVEIAPTLSISLRGQYNIDSNTITINDKLDDHIQVSVLAHELGHALLHNKNNKENLKVSHMELQADTFDVLISKHLNIEIADNRKSHIKDILDQLDKDEDIIEIISPVMNLQKDMINDLNETIKQLQLSEFNKNYNEFAEKEYMSDEVKIKENEIVDILYTAELNDSYEFADYELQISYDLKNNQEITTYDNSIYKFIHKEDISIEDETKNLKADINDWLNEVSMDRNTLSKYTALSLLGVDKNILDEKFDLEKLDIQSNLNNNKNYLVNNITEEFKNVLENEMDIYINTNNEKEILFEKLENQRDILSNEQNKLLELMNSSSWSAVEEEIIHQQKVVDKELYEFKKLSNNYNNYIKDFNERNKDVDLDNDGVPDRIDIDDSRNAVQDVKDLDEVNIYTDKTHKKEKEIKKEEQSL